MVFSPKIVILVIGMNTRRATTQRAKERIANVGDHDNQAPQQDNQVPPLEDIAISDQVSVVRSPINDGEIRDTNLDQSIT